MLFNSYTFLLLFLPVVLVGCFMLARWRASAAALWLVLASLFFYGWWDARYVPLLVASVGFNYLCRPGHRAAWRRHRALDSERRYRGEHRACSATSSTRDSSGRTSTRCSGPA